MSFSDLSKLPATHSVETSFAYDPASSWAGSMSLSEIIIEDRMRDDLGDIAGMAESLATLGQLQSLLVDSKKRLIAGGRRYAAMTMLGWTHALVIRIPEQGEAIHYMRELEENLQRKPMLWLEHAKTIRRIHQARRKESLDKGLRWTMAQTGSLFNVSHSQVSNVLMILDYIDQGFKELTACGSIHEAYQKLTSHVEAIATKALAAKAKEDQALKTTYAENLMDKVKQNAPVTEIPAINLAGVPASEGVTETPSMKFPVIDNLAVNRERAQRMLCVGDSLKVLMPALPASCVNHIFTDPPYGIPMENLGSVTKLEHTEKEHDRESNIRDFEPFLAEAYRVIMPKGFCVFFCDVEHIGRLLEIGYRIGFSGQAHPLICGKDANRNDAPFYNTTKDYECVMLLRKEGAQLNAPVTSSRLEFKFDSGEKKKYTHPFAKPRSLCLQILKMFAKPGERILDPYCGECSLVTSIIKFGAIPMGFDLIQDHITRGTAHVAAELGELKQPELFQ